jgi:hypothetical protein
MEKIHLGISMERTLVAKCVYSLHYQECKLKVVCAGGYKKGLLLLEVFLKISTTKLHNFSIM